VEGDRINPANIVAVSIIRAGDSLLDCFMKIAPEAQVGKILIQRNETTKQPELFYSKLPAVASKTIMLLDPMLATGGSAKAAIQVLLDNGALESNIVFLNVVSCPEGIAAISKAYPAVQIVTAFVDSGLNDKVSLDSSPSMYQYPRDNMYVAYCAGVYCARLGRLRRPLLRDRELQVEAVRNSVGSYCRLLWFTLSSCDVAVLGSCVMHYNA
jgi:hypothetical protein